MPQSPANKEKSRDHDSLGPVGVLLLLTGAAHDLRGLGTGLYAQDLVGAAQVLLDGGFGEEEAPTYLRIGEPFCDKLQGLYLAGGEGIEIRRATLRR